jgi:hypothetical protein
VLSKSSARASEKSTRAEKITRIAMGEPPERGLRPVRLDEA